MELTDPNYVLDLFKKLIMSVFEEMRNPTNSFDLNEKNYKRNIGLIAQIDVSNIYLRLSSILTKSMN